MKHLIIVAGKSEEQYAEYIKALVSQNDDTDDMIIGTKDGDVSVTILNETQYRNNKQNLSSDEKVLFIGDNNLTKELCKLLKPVYNKYGMIYSCLGTQACLFVEQVVPQKEYNDFIKEANELQENVKNIAIKNGDLAKSVVAGAAIGAGLEVGTSTVGAVLWAITGSIVNPIFAVGGAALLIGGGLGAIKYNSKKKEIIKQQYSFLLLKCYMEYLNDFLS